MAEEEAGVAVVDVRVVDVEEVAAEDPSEAGAAVQDVTVTPEVTPRGSGITTCTPPGAAPGQAAAA